MESNIIKITIFNNGGGHKEYVLTGYNLENSIIDNSRIELKDDDHKRIFWFNNISELSYAIEYLNDNSYHNIALQTKSTLKENL